MPQLSLEHLEKVSKKEVFIETGTYKGDTVQTALNFGFKKIHSIEIEQNNFIECSNRFKTNANVKIWHGDSPDILSFNIIPFLTSEATFWLDAHSSRSLQVPGSDKYGKCPLLNELEAIGKSSIKNHVIIADDVRLFGTISWDYLSKDYYISKLLEINPNYSILYLDGGTSFGRKFPEDDILVAYLA